MRLNRERFSQTDADPATVIIRTIVGYIFIAEGLQKFLYSDTLGVGRFLKIGIPYAEIAAPFVGVCEVVLGSMILFGVLTRLSVLPQIVIVFVALATTQLSLLTSQGLLPFTHEARNDLLMLFGLIFLLKKGAGAYYVDLWLLQNKRGFR